MSAGLLFNDIFEVLVKDPDGKKYDKVSRLKCRSDLYEMDLLLDINCDIYPLNVGDKITLSLARTLNLDGTALAGHYDSALQSGKQTLMDKYEYVMHGKIFKYKDNSTGGQLKVEIYISYGGLLMQLTGDPKKLEHLEVDDNIFLLIRKV